jgi:hypothetical protein
MEQRPPSMGWRRAGRRREVGLARKACSASRAGRLFCRLSAVLSLGEF